LLCEEDPEPEERSFFFCTVRGDSTTGGRGGTARAGCLGRVLLLGTVVMIGKAREGRRRV
jgi:hypothetical protein